MFRSTAEYLTISLQVIKMNKWKRQWKEKSAYKERNSNE